MPARCTCARPTTALCAGRQCFGRLLPAHRQADRRGARHRRRRGPSGLRLPERERRLRAGRASTPAWSGSARHRRPSARWAASRAPSRSPQARGVPCLPGYQGEDQSDQRFAAEAQRIGFPVMVKAAAGGGGRGMRLVTEAAQLQAARAERALGGAVRFRLGRIAAGARAAASRAMSRCRSSPTRTATASTWASAIARCSGATRRSSRKRPARQSTRRCASAMGRCAVELAQAAGYVGAGTVEFLLEGGGVLT